jgi:L-methionine (R)-S-oxide reductase
MNSRYASLLQELEMLLEGESDFIANAANTSAFIYQNIENLNWVGFYFLKGEELVLGPFQGRPACTRIPKGRGVCGKALELREVLNVADVETFSDHIVCDKASKSELVVPLLNDSKLMGVLDVDAPIINRFDGELERFLISAASIFSK